MPGIVAAILSNKACRLIALPLLRAVLLPSQCGPVLPPEMRSTIFPSQLSDEGQSVVQGEVVLEDNDTGSLGTERAYMQAL